MNEINLHKLKSLCSKIGSGATPRGGSSVYMDSGRVRLIRSQNVRENEFDYQGIVYISEEAADQLSNVEVEKEDILLNITGDSVARVCVVDPNVLPARVNQHVAIVRAKRSNLLPLYLNYTLNTRQFQHQLLGLAAAGATRKALTKSMIEDLVMKLPDLDHQRFVVHQLKILDDKIALNRRTNETLEAMAQALFKSWFVNFDPVIDNALDAGRELPDALAKRVEVRKAVRASGKYTPLGAEVRALFPDGFVWSEELGKWVPEGWGVKRLSDFGRIVTGNTPSKNHPEHWGDEVEFLTPTDMKGNTVYAPGTSRQLSSDGANKQRKRLLPPESIAVSCIGSDMGKVCLISKLTVTNQQINSIISKHPEYVAFIYCYICQEYEQLRTLGFGGSTMPILNKTDFSKLISISPSNDLAVAFDELVGSSFKLLKFNSLESSTLSSLRDVLLRKLIG